MSTQASQSLVVKQKSMRYARGIMRGRDLVIAVVILLLLGVLVWAIQP